jgi:hypothetical protein
MIKQLITFSSMAAGSAGFAFIGYLQTHPLALTEPVVADVRTWVAPAARPVDPPVQVPELVFDAELISAKPRPVARVSKRPAPPRPVEPCADWRSIGASYVTEGRAVGSRLVRELCER